MSRPIAFICLAALVAAGCSTTGTVVVVDDYQFEFQGSSSVDVSDWPRVHAHDRTLEVRNGRLLLDGVDHGPVRRRQAVRMNSRGEITVGGQPRSPTGR